MNRCATSEPSCLTLRERRWQPIAIQDDLMLVVEWETWPADSARRSSFEWSDAAAAWVDASGMPFNMTHQYIALPRLNAYFRQPRPRYRSALDREDLVR